MHERFAYLMAEGVGCGEAYRRLNPHVSDPNASGCRVAARPEVKKRIAEIQTEVHTRAVMGLDAKRDLLRQMIEGTVPTKVVRKSDGKVEAVYDRLLALQTDAKISGELEGRQQTDGNALALTFKMYGRDDKLAPKEWLEAELIPVTKEIEAAPADLSQYSQPVDAKQPGLKEVVKQVYTVDVEPIEAERFAP
jgi:phage terminase small subunit